MFGLGALGKLLILLGVFIVLMGLLLMAGDKIPWVGRLPGDILIKKEKFTLYFPLTTSGQRGVIRGRSQSGSCRRLDVQVFKWCYICRLGLVILKLIAI